MEARAHRLDQYRKEANGVRQLEQDLSLDYPHGLPVSAFRLLPPAVSCLSAETAGFCLAPRFGFFCNICLIRNAQAIIIW